MDSKKSEAAEIDRQNGRLPAVERPRGGQKRAVATQDGTSKSTVPAISLRVRQGSAVLMMAAVSLSIQVSMSRSRSQARRGDNFADSSSRAWK